MALTLSVERQQTILTERERHERAVESWIRAAQTTGDIRADIDPRITTLGVFGMVNSVYRWFAADGRRSAEEIGAEFCRVLLDGLRPLDQSLRNSRSSAP